MHKRNVAVFLGLFSSCLYGQLAEHVFLSPDIVNSVVYNLFLDNSQDGVTQIEKIEDAKNCARAFWKTCKYYNATVKDCIFGSHSRIFVDNCLLRYCRLPRTLPEIEERVCDPFFDCIKRGHIFNTMDVRREIQNFKKLNAFCLSQSLAEQAAIPSHLDVSEATNWCKEHIFKNQDHLNKALWISVTNEPSNKKIVNFLIHCGAGINHNYAHIGIAPLTMAIYCNQPLEIVEYLIDKGADINAQSEIMEMSLNCLPSDLRNHGQRETALIVAAKQGKVDTVQRLIERGADKRIKSTHGTALEQTEIILKRIQKIGRLDGDPAEEPLKEVIALLKTKKPEEKISFKIKKFLKKN